METKLLQLRGPSTDLPHKLLDAQIAYTIDSGRVFMGQSSDDDLNTRTEFPFQNLEILTENSTDIISSWYGQFVQNRGMSANYATTLNPTSEWDDVVIDNDKMIIKDIYHVMLFINYSINDNIGDCYKHGRMSVSYNFDSSNPSEPQIVDDGNIMSEIVPSEIYDPVKRNMLCQLKWFVDGPIGSQFLVLKYRNLSDTFFHFSFNMMRPQIKRYERVSKPHNNYGRIHNAQIKISMHGSGHF